MKGKVLCKWTGGVVERAQAWGQASLDLNPNLAPWVSSLISSLETRVATPTTQHGFKGYVTEFIKAPSRLWSTKMLDKYWL